MTNVLLAHGTQLKIGNGASPEVFTAIPQITEGPDGPNIAPDVLSFFHHGSDWEVKKVGSKKSGQVTFGVLYDGDDATLVSVETAANNRTRKNFQELLPDGTQFAFSGYVSAAWSANEGDAEKCRFTIDIDGAIVITHS
ncbi:conserved hypothetical protein [Gammaproteobacteria bacterium]